MSDEQQGEKSKMDSAMHSAAGCSFQVNQGQNVDTLTNEVLDECNRRAYLDGTFFAPDLDKLSFDGTVWGICQICKKENNKDHSISGTLKSSSNYVRHLKNVHKRAFQEYEDYAKQKNKKLKTDNNEDKYKTFCSFSQARFDNNVVNYLLESMSPLNTVESPAFRKIFDDMKIKHHGKELQHLSARTVGRRIEQTFLKTVADISAELANVSFVCTTADTWSSRHRRFVGMTVHWIDELTMERKSYAIACRRLKGDHSYDRVAESIKDIHASYGLSETQVFATVTDNGSNFVKAFREFGLRSGDYFFEGETVDNDKNASNAIVESESEDDSDHAEMELFDDCNDSIPVLPQYFRCASHTLNLIVTTDMLADIKMSKTLKQSFDEMIARCSSLWNLQKSPKKAEKLCSAIGQPLKRPVVTRWNSLYDALKQIQSLKEAILQHSNELDITNPLRDTDFRFMEEYISCNKPVAEGLDILQGETKCYYGYLLPTLITIRNKLQEWIKIIK
ncbi:uncharacterized protein [Venturia canescens]|uniref:uncharacterized protein isoform X2 n=1 Tax=Venturia canescens TaxID=32260 RepID=UPI001C9D54E4|nr:uncharacterized protein LOC122407635 isoform X2 [Venturia canescens]